MKDYLLVIVSAFFFINCELPVVGVWNRAGLFGYILRRKSSFIYHLTIVKRTALIEPRMIWGI